MCQKVSEFHQEGIHSRLKLSFHQASEATLINTLRRGLCTAGTIVPRGLNELPENVRNGPAVTIMALECRK
jgi:hypothetical protein